MPQPVEIEALIDSMALSVRTFSGEPAPVRPRGRWWVLVCGTGFDPGDFDQRERAREALREEAVRGGVNPPEFVWVWDEGNTAQLLAGRFADLDRAEEYSRSLARRGLRPRVIEAWEED